MLRLERIDGLFDSLVGDRAGLGGEWFAEFECLLKVAGTREFVLAGKLFGILGDTVEQELVVVDDPEAIDFDLLGGLALNVGDGFGGAFGGSCTELHDGADSAEWIALLADCGAELHHRLVVVAGRLCVKHCIGRGSEGFDGLAVVFEAACVVGEAGEDAHDIAVHDCGGIVLRDGADCGGGIGADAGQGLPFLGSGRLWIERDVFLREFVEIAGAAVVAEAFPVFEHIFSGCFGKGFEVGEAFEPAIKVGQHRLDLCLLRHELGDDGLIE